MKKNYRSFDEGFRRQVVSPIDSGGLTKSRAAREYRLSPSLIERWRQQIHDGTMGSPAARKKYTSSLLEAKKEEPECRLDQKAVQI